MRKLMNGEHLFDNHMKRLLTAVALALLTLPAGAYDREENASMKHEVRVGWGDMMYESAVFYNSSARHDYRYSGHIFGEYQYHFNYWLSAGLQLDWEKVSWNSNEFFTNSSILPDVRFTYFHRPWVNMYSGISLGLCVNSGTDVDYKGRTAVCSPCLGLTAFGISVGRRGWFGAFELGGLNAMLGKNEVYMAGSRLLSFSVGYRF